MTFSVDVELLDDLVAQLARFGRALETVQADVQNRMNQVHATWRGEAAEEHAAAHARWRRGSHEMHAALATMRTVAVTARGNYAAALRANRALWSS